MRPLGAGNDCPLICCLHRAYDGRKNFFTTSPIVKGDNGKQHEFTVTVPEADPKPGVPPEEQGRRFTIQVKHVADIDLDAITQFCAGKRQSISNIESMLTAFMSVNVLLRSNLHEKYTSSGAAERRFFTMDDHVPISDGAVVAQGFAQSFRPSIGHPAIQLDTAFSAFVAPGPLINVAKGLLGRNNGGFRGGRGGGRGGDRGRGGAGRGGYGGPPAASGDLQSLSQFDIQKLRKTLFGAKFKVIHRTPNKIMSFGGLTLKSAEELTFTKDDGTKQSVADYIKATYNKPLQYPRLPCVVTGKKTYIPMELVVILPFHSLPPLKLTPDQTAEMIKVSARPPQTRRDNIMKWRRQLAWEARPEVKSWGLQIKSDFTEVGARVLNPPQIAYAGGPRGLVKPAGGAWNLRGKKFFKSGKPLTSWAVVSFDRFFDVKAMQGFVTYLVQTMKMFGTNVVNDKPPCFGPINPMNRASGNNPVYDALNQAARGAYEAGKRQGPPQLIIIVMSGRDTGLYEEIKRSATRLNAPVPTQCLLSKKLQQDRGLDQYCANVSLKINAKLGGINVSIPLSELPGIDNKTMLVGADVGHPPQGNGPIRPSIAATVAATNGENNNFKPCVRLQEGRSEPIVEMGNMITTHIKEFEKNSRTLPESIVMFRDGVSESQYAAIVEIECKAILDAASKIKPGYKPKLCFIICAKRHSMRFFAKGQNDVDRSGNLPAGTVVDNTVTHPYAFDFYLQAHAGLVGTARPTHLVCLRNDQAFKVDDIQRLSNALSYNFQRATRSVSVVSLAYYADIICTATRSMVYEDDGSAYEPTESGASTSGPTKPEAEAFDSMKIQQIIEKGGAFNSVQW